MTVTLIAELGSNHRGVVGEAMALMRAVQGSATHAKLQDHRGQHITNLAKHPPWMTKPEVESRADYMRRTSFDWHAWETLSAYCRELGMKFVVSPFSVWALRNHLEAGRLDAIKIASGQLSNVELLKEARDSGLQTFVSCGMSTWDETKAAMAVFWENGWPKPEPVLMQCTSQYPCEPRNAGLQLLAAMRDGPFQLGYSDHTIGNWASLAAITLGARVIERHVGFDRRGYGSDAAHSLTIDEFRDFCAQARALETALASEVTKDQLAVELSATRKAFLHTESPVTIDSLAPTTHSVAPGGEQCEQS